MSIRVFPKTATIGFRLFLAFLCIFIVLIIQSTFAFYNSRRIMTIQHSALTNELKLLTFRDTLSQVRIKLFKLLGTVDPTKMEELKAEIEASFPVIAEDGAALHVPKEALANSQATYQQIIQLHWDFQTTQAYTLINSTSAEEYAALYKLLETLSRQIETTMQATVARTNTQFLAVTIFLCAAGLVIVALWGWYLIRSIANPIKQAVDYAQMIADGDLSMTIEAVTHDETGRLLRAFKTMTARLNAMRAEIEILIQAVQSGNLHIRGNASPFAGSWRDLIQGMNTVVDAFAAPINKTAQYIDRLAKGDVPDKITEEYHGDFNTIKKNFNLLIEATNGVTRIAQDIADGNLNAMVKTRSEQDEMMQTLAHMVRSLQDAANVAEKIANDDLQVIVAPKSEQDMLNMALQRMVTNLRMKQEKIEASMTEIERQNWLKTGQAELSNAMRGELEPSTLAEKIMTYLATYLHAQVGTLYLANTDRVLRLIGSYAYATRKGNRNEFKWGEGLVGQAALEKRSILFTHVPEDYLAVTSGLGEAAPRQIVVTPLLYEGEVKGIVELGTVEEFSAMQRSFLDQVAENIAITFHSAQARTKMRELLEETREQARELQAQQEQLRVANEELESQTDALRESEQKLQTQQEELRQINEELSERSQTLEQQQKTLSDKNSELENARKLIEEKAKELELTSKYKSEFLANMSHELRTPLNSLLILSKLLSENKDQNLTDKQVEFARTIYASGSELLELINEVLDLSKVEAGKMSVNVEDMRLKGLMSYVEQNFTHVAEKKKLALKVSLADGLPASILTDRQRVEQILKNLLSNAIKFTQHGEIRVSIARPAAGVRLASTELVSQQTIAFAVADTGIGIPEAKRALIFEAFQQADGTTSRKYGGTGLGLSIVREMARLLGGEIQLESQEGHGSTFTLYLPEVFKAKEAEERPAVKSDVFPVKPEPQKPVSAPGAPTVEAMWDDRHTEIAPTDKTLLIIEDDPKFGKILFDLARERGFKVLSAGDGSAGLQLAYQYRPNAIILDIQLPGMDGWMVMEKLKHNPETRHIPVHFISVLDQALDAWKMGAIGYLTKPVDLQQLHDAFETIETAVARRIKKLLLVEDDDATRLSLTELLHGNDVEIITSSTGADAYQRLQTEPFDCMVLDLGLADMSGFDLLERIHQSLSSLHVPIVIYTAQNLTKEDELRLKKHAESIVIKGVKSPERLIDEVTLFLHRVETNLPEPQRKRLRMIHDKESVLSGKTLLLVDDDIRNIFALSSVLEEKGMQVLVAEHGKEALTLVARHPEIEIVLMDIMMPEMDGYEAIRQIRAQPQFARLPIIALTAKAMKGDRQRCIDAGANDYLSKPVDTAKLLSLLRVWLY